MDDALLTKLFVESASGSRTAQGELCQYVTPQLQRRFSKVSSGIRGPVIELDDLVADSIAKIIESLPRFEFRSAPEAMQWCFRVADNTRSNRLKHEFARSRNPSRRPHSLSTLHGAARLEVISNRTSPSEAARRSEVRRDVLHAVDQLPDLQRECMELFLAGACHGRIGEQKGLRPYEVTRVIKKAAQSLRAFLDERNYFNDRLKSGD